MTRTRNFKLSMLAAAGVFFFAYAWENVQAIKLGYRIEGLRKEISDLENTNNYLKKEIRASLSPEKLQAEALKIGLVYPEPDALVLLDGASVDKYPAAGHKPSKKWLAQLFWFANRRAKT
jgi:hypothetical protein